MRTIGVLGGMSWESSAVYYRLLNQAVRARLGGLHSASVLLHSCDFADIAAFQQAGDWAGAAARLAATAQALERAGAGLLLIATNTMHIVADEVQAALSIPLLHIADAVCAHGLTTVGLLGTRFTMEQPFLRARLERHGLAVTTPDADDRALVHQVIFDELVQGVISDASREAYRAVMTRLLARGAQGIILGCTEIGLLVQDGDVPAPLFDTTVLHAHAAVAAAFSDDTPMLTNTPTSTGGTRP